jgi:hypothetical protein
MKHLVAIVMLASLPSSAMQSARGAATLSQVTFDEYIYPPLVRALYVDEPNSVPDTQSVRGYNAAVAVVFNTLCGDPGPGPQMALNSYLSPDFRKLSRNPVDANTLGNILEGTFRNPVGQPLRAKEGDDDARTFLKRYPCQTAQAVRLRNNLHRLIGQRQSLPVEPENDAKMIAMINPRIREERGITLRPIEETPLEQGMASCRRWRADMVKRYPYLRADDQEEFCRCIAPQLVAAPLAPADRAGLIKDFEATYARLMETQQTLMTRVLKNCQ